MQQKQIQIWAGRIALIILGVPVMFLVALFLEKAQLGKTEDPFGPQFSWVATPTPPPPPGLKEAKKDLAAKDAVICGNVRAWVPKERNPADACAVTALKAKKPFRLKYHTYTSHDIFDATLIGNRKGHVYFISSKQVCCGDITPFVEQYLCRQPIIVAINGKRRIACKNKRNLTP